MLLVLPLCQWLKLNDDDDDDDLQMRMINSTAHVIAA